MSEHDKAIIETNARVADCILLARTRDAYTLPLNGGELGAAIEAAQAARAAKREAETPKLLTAEEAAELHARTYHTTTNRSDRMQAVLTGCIERAALVADRALFECRDECADIGAARNIVRKALTGKD